MLLCDFNRGGRSIIENTFCLQTTKFPMVKQESGTVWQQDRFYVCLLPSPAAAEHHQDWDHGGHSPSLVLWSSHALDAESFLWFKCALTSAHNIQYIAHTFLADKFCFTVNQILTLYLNICPLLPFTGTDIHLHQ